MICNVRNFIFGDDFVQLSTVLVTVPSQMLCGFFFVPCLKLLETKYLAKMSCLLHTNHIYRHDAKQGFIFSIFSSKRDLHINGNIITDLSISDCLTLSILNKVVVDFFTKCICCRYQFELHRYVYPQHMYYKEIRKKKHK